MVYEYLKELIRRDFEDFARQICELNEGIVRDCG